MRKLCSVLSVIIIISLVVLVFYGNPFVKWKLSNNTREYLVNEQGYQASDIKQIKGCYQWNDVEKYIAKVIFSDDLEREYVYAYNLEGEIYQSDGIDGSHSELLRENEVEWTILEEFHQEIADEMIDTGMTKEDFYIREVNFINPLDGNFGLYALVDLYKKEVTIEYRKGKTGDMYIFKEYDL